LPQHGVETQIAGFERRSKHSSRTTQHARAGERPNSSLQKVHKVIIGATVETDNPMSTHRVRSE